MTEDEKNKNILKAHSHVQELIKRISEIHNEFVASDIEGFDNNQKIIMALRAFNFVSSSLSTTFHARLRELELEYSGDFKP